MLKSEELKQEITAKRMELENLQREQKITEAKNAATELNKLVDELDVALAMERLRKLKSDGGIFINGNGDSRETPAINFSRKIGIPGNEYEKNFFDAFRNKFSNEATLKLREGSLPQGGYLVPTEFHNGIQSALEEENVMRKIATVISTQSEYIIPFVTSKPTASWISEGETIQLTNEAFNRMSLGAYKLATAITCSNELLADSYYNLEAHLIYQFAKGLARAEEEAFLIGAPDETTGTVSRPTGILTTIGGNSDCYKETTGAEITADDLINLQYSVRRPYRRNACFLTSDETLALIRKLKDSTQNFIWQPSTQEGEPSRLFGQPILTSPFMPSPESGKIAVLYGDFSYYVIAERGQRTVRALRELFALQDISAFLMLERIDGKLTDPEAVRGLKIK